MVRYILLHKLRKTLTTNANIKFLHFNFAQNRTSQAFSSVHHELVEGYEHNKTKDNYF